jgi:ATP-binding cassette subfamily B protein
VGIRADAGRRALVVIGVPRARGRLIGLAALGLIQGTLETAVIVQLTAVAFAAAGGHRPVGLPFIGALPRSPLLLVAGVTGTTAVIAGIRLWSERLLAAASTEAMVTVRMRLLRAYCAAGWLEQAGERSGTLQELFSTSPSAVGMSTLSASAALVAAAQLAVLTAAAVSISPLAAVAVVTVGAFGVLVAHPFRKRTRLVAKESAGAHKELAALVAETTQLGRELRTNGVHEAHVDRAASPVHRAAVLTGRVRQESRLVPATTRDVTVIFVAVGLGILTETSSVGVGALGAMGLLLVRAIGYGQQVSGAVQTLADRRAHRELLAAALDRYDRSAPPTGGQRLDGVGTVRFEHVSFTYPGAQRPALRDVNLVVEPGEVVGVVGPSGAGKSTLLHLLLGLVRPDSGRLTADGVDVAGTDIDDWLGRTAYVPQDPRLLTGTVAENIRFLREGIDDAAVARAVRAAALESDLAGWSDGLDHPVGPLGNGLSGGQRQRVVIARALAGAPELLVLDEPTSALDTDNEAAVRDTIARVRSTMTVVLVAHRQSTLDACDRLVEVRDGRLVELRERVGAAGAALVSR